MKQISIITVVLNNREQIKNAIESVIEQSYKDIEYIVIDGGSTDGTLDVIQKYRQEISLVISEKDKGIYDAMNKGISLAKGSLVGIVNSDDWLDENVLSVVGDIHQLNPESIIYGLLREYKDGIPWRTHTSSYKFLHHRMIPHQTCFVPRSIYDKNGIYDIRYKFLADYDFLLRCYNADTHFIQIDKVISNARTGGATHSNRDEAKREQLTVLYRNGVISENELKKMQLKMKFKKVISFLPKYY